MMPGWIQVECPVCHVQQPARLRLTLGDVDYTANAVAVDVQADMSTVNEHVKLCKRRHDQHD